MSSERLSVIQGSQSQIETCDSIDTIKKLREPLPKALIKSRKQGGANVEYVEWSAVADILDRYAPGWTYEIKEVRELAKMVVATVAITIEGTRRENTGIENLDMKGYGDPVSNAVAMAFKRAAAMFGVGRDLYQDHSVPAILEAAETYKERQLAQPPATPKPEINTAELHKQIKVTADSIELSLADMENYLKKNNFGSKLSEVAPENLGVVLNWVKLQEQKSRRIKENQKSVKPAPATVQKQSSQRTQSAPGFPIDPLAKGTDDLVTIRQIASITAIANSVGLDAEAECERLLKCKLNEISRRAASSMIDHLKSRANSMAGQQTVSTTSKSNKEKPLDPQAPLPSTEQSVLEDLIKQILAILPEAHTKLDKLQAGIFDKFGKTELSQLTKDELSQVLRGYRDHARKIRERMELIKTALKEECKLEGREFDIADMTDLSDFSLTELGKYLQGVESRLTVLREQQSKKASA